MQAMELHRTIFSKLLSKQGMRASVSENFGHIMSLTEYIKTQGNPLMNGHSLHAARTDQSICVSVAVPGGLAEVGRYSLEKAVDAGWGEDAPLPLQLQDLKKMQVDELSQVRVVQQLVAEYKGRQAVLEALGVGAIQPTASRASSSQVGGCGAGASTRGGASTERRNGRSPSKSQPSRASRRPSKCERAAAAETLRTPSKSTTAATRQRRSRSRSPIAALKFAAASSNSSLDKAYNKICFKIFSLGKVFTKQDWEVKKRGKEKTAKNIMESIDNFAERCRKCSGEDLIEDLDGHRDAINAMRRLIQQAKDDSLEAWDEVEMLPFIDRTEKCLHFLAPGFTDDAPMLANSLLKMKAGVL